MIQATILLLLATQVIGAGDRTFPGRPVLALDGPFQITSDDPTDPAARWQPIPVPGAFETVLGDDFDGVATYRRNFTIPADFPGERLLIQFDAAATEAHVWFNDDLVGTHLGGWTGFCVEVTELARRGQQNTLMVMLDEKVGHNSQGFLPVIAPHFGGLWQSVRLIGVSEPWINHLGLLAVGDPNTGRLSVEAPLMGEPGDVELIVEIDIEGQQFRAPVGSGRRLVHTEGFRAWDTAEPHLYPVRFRLYRRDGTEIDRVETRAAYRSVRTEGRRLLLNERPLNVRGMLEWGYFPPLLAPAPSDEIIRREIEECRARGFNLIKFCLWLPPRRILDLLDEAGMLAWMEYPTWHPKFDDEHRDDLIDEFEEFFAHDRNHPSVLLRSLTCETGPSASIEVIRDLYDRAHDRIPGAIVVDDSSWISWNRVFDFYDDHPYGNNRDWPAKLDALNDYIEKREAKPLILGEAIAADTWLDAGQRGHADEGDWWRSLHADAAVAWEQRIGARFGAGVIEDLRRWSLRFGMNQRKDQIETYREQVPDGGYVVSVARDFRKAEMGLSDHANRPKWDPPAWSWHGDTMLVLGRGSRRSVTAGATFGLPVSLAHHGKLPLDSRAIRARFDSQETSLEHGPIAPGSVVPITEVRFDAPAVEQPTEIELSIDVGPARNSWSIWAVPETKPAGDRVKVVDRLTPELFEELLAGARILLRAGNRPGSFRVRPHWFLRGAPWFPTHPLHAEIPAEFFLDLMVKDLHPEGLLPVGGLFDSIDPIVAFWDDHDLTEVVDWAVAFETGVGEGRLLVTAFEHDDSAAGAWLLSRFRQHLADGPAPRSELSEEVRTAIADRLEARNLNLTDRPWEFRPEPPDQAPADWTEIRVGRSWEGQGHGALDGWARYRLQVEVPADWAGEALYVHFEGVDDAYEVFFDGEQKGAGGDIKNRLTAFEDKTSHLLAEQAAAGTHLLEVRVFDWYGAGGIHRPVSLSTRPLTLAASFLQGR